MAIAKIQLLGHFAVDRARSRSLVEQIVRHLRLAIERGNTAPGARLPSSRALARQIGVSRNTVLAAYGELTALGLIRGRHGAGVFVVAQSGYRATLDLERALRDAQFPRRSVALLDSDGSALSVGYSFV